MTPTTPSKPNADARSFANVKPTGADLNRAGSATPAAHVSITTKDGVALTAAVRHHDDPSAAVVLVHGFTGSQDQPEVRRVAGALVEAGCSVITYDGRGHGTSGGLCTLGEWERLDVAAAVELASAESPRVILVGASMGGIAVLRCAADDPAVAGVVTVSCPAEWKIPRSLAGLLSVAVTQTGIGRRLAATRLRVRIAQHPLRGVPPVQLADRLKCPLAVVHGRSDRFLSTTQAQLLFAATGGPRRLSLVPGMGHAFDAKGDRTIVAAVQWVLEQDRARSAATAGAP